MLGEKVSEMLSMTKQQCDDQAVTSEVGDAAVPTSFRTGYGHQR
jgi:hypothetical protein